MNHFKELTNSELEEINGGFWPAVVGAVGVGVAIYNAGYAAGKDRAQSGKRR